MFIVKQFLKTDLEYSFQKIKKKTKMEKKIKKLNEDFTNKTQ